MTYCDDCGAHRSDEGVTMKWVDTTQGQFILCEDCIEQNFGDEGGE